MATIPPLTALRSEDYPTERSWIGGLFQTLNRFFLAVSGAVNGNIVFGENIPAVTQSLTFSWNAVSNLPKSFAWGLRGYQPVETRVAQCLENGTPKAAAIAWAFTGTVIQVTDLVIFENGAARAPTVGATYRLTIRANP